MNTTPTLDYKLRLLSTKLSVMSGEYQREAIEMAGKLQEYAPGFQTQSIIDAVVMRSVLTVLCNNLAQAFQETADTKPPA